MRLTEGQSAPDFSVTSVDGKQIHLSDYSDKLLLVSFFRYAGCPFCNLTLIKLIERYDNFVARGLETVAFFQSSDDSIIKYVSAKQPPFAMVADPSKVVFDAYGVESSVLGAVKSIAKAPAVVSAIARRQVVQGRIDGDAFLMPAQFVITQDGTIAKAFYGSDFGDKLPFIDIEQLIISKATSHAV